MTDDVLSRKRRIAKRVLGPVLDANALTLVYALIEREFGRGSSFAAHRFLRRVSELVQNIDPLQRELFGQITQLSTLDAEEIGPDPLHESGNVLPLTTAHQHLAQQQARTAPTAIEQPTFRPPPARVSELGGLFGSLLQTLRLTAAQRDPGMTQRLPEWLADRASELGIGAVTQRELTQWATLARRGSHSASAALSDITPEEVSSLLHAVYVWLCDEFGPVLTDRIMGKAIRETEDHPAATVYPPRSFL